MLDRETEANEGRGVLRAKQPANLLVGMCQNPGFWALESG